MSWLKLKLMLRQSQHLSALGAVFFCQVAKAKTSHFLLVKNGAWSSYQGWLVCAIISMVRNAIQTYIFNYLFAAQLLVTITINLLENICHWTLITNIDQFNFKNQSGATWNNITGSTVTIAQWWWDRQSSFFTCVNIEFLFIFYQLSSQCCVAQLKNW